MFKRLIILSFLLSASALARPVEPSPLAPLKALAGQWTLAADGKVLPFRMTYALGSKGSIVTEQFGKELSVFFESGGEIWMTHYCNAGNQPRLKQIKASAQRLDFALQDIVNLKTPTTPHVHRVIYHLEAADKMTLEIIWKRPEGERTERYTLTRATK